jgi:hypothetical protein
MTIAVELDLQRIGAHGCDLAWLLAKVVGPDAYPVTRDERGESLRGKLRREELRDQQSRQ